VDRSPATPRAARQRLAGYPNVELPEGELSRLPLPARSCDAALLVLVLAYLEDPEPALAEARRVLRRGGRLVAVDAARHADEDLRRRIGQVRPGFAPEELAEGFRRAGLTGVRVRALPPEPGARGPGLVICTGGAR